MSGLWNVAVATRLLLTVCSVSTVALADPTETPRPNATERPVISRAGDSGAATGTSAKAKPPQTGDTILKDQTSGIQFLTNDCVVSIGGTTIVGEAKHAFLETLLKRRYPGYNLRFRNLGWEGDTVFQQERPLNFPAMISSVREQRATIILAGFGLMESLRGDEGLADFTRAYNALLDELSRMTPRIVLLSPFRHEPRRPAMSAAEQKNKALERYVRAVRDMARRRKLLFVDLFQLQNRNLSSDEEEPLTLNGIHPSAYGYWRAAHETAKSLAATQPEWTVEIDARNRKFQAKGTQLSSVQISTSTVQFRSLDEALPGPVYLRSDSSSSVSKARTLKISSLLPGRYVLKIDGVPLSVQSQLFWEQGRVLTHGPEFDQTATLRELIVRKNTDFFNYWRPQNWAFLNGDLIGQPSSHEHDDFGARWFPGETQRFLPLIEAKEKTINQRTKPEFHDYELHRVE